MDVDAHGCIGVLEMSYGARTQWMSDQIKIIKCQHTLGTGEALHILKTRETYERLRTPDITLREVMNLCHWIKGAARFLLMQQFFEMMTAENRAVNIEDLNDRCVDIAYHHENLLGPKEFKVSRFLANQLDQVSGTRRPAEFPDRLPLINYEAFKPHWSEILKKVKEPIGRFENLLKILWRLPDWLFLPVADAGNVDAATGLRYYFLSFAMNKSQTRNEIDTLASVSGDSVLNNYSAYYQHFRDSHRQQLDEFGGWLSGRQLTTLPKWEERQLYDYDRLILRYNNEMIGNRQGARRELAIAYVIKELGGGMCDEQFLDEINDHLLKAIRNSKKRLEMTIGLEMMREMDAKRIASCEYIISLLLENRAFLKRYFNS